MSYIFLADLSVVKPDPGLIFWTSIIFLGLWFFLGRKVFRPIQEALKKREDEIQESLDEALKAREEMKSLKASNERILAEAREERSKILKEAKEVRDNMIAEAKEQAKVEAKKIVTDAKEQIENQRLAAVTDLKNQAGMMAVSIAEQLLRKELKNDSTNGELVDKLVKEINLN